MYHGIAVCHSPHIRGSSGRQQEAFVDTANLSFVSITVILIVYTMYSSCMGNNQTWIMDATIIN